ncbi:uncharacterized protein LOC126844714 [Adelges cooleyi]|uniref:uncharacterized protein LOC126844714 n=1 Tax=Adelges cooleyi TaxID=133065 RepID=UPI00217F6FFD|nr:uncharacterized protein LOC126844714 [Adelges cooleyi]
MESRKQFFIVMLFLVIAVESAPKNKPFVLDRIWMGFEENNIMLFNNYFKTFEEDEIQFDYDDVKSLKEPFDFHLDKMDEIKTKALKKYDNKCAALHCVNNLMLLHIVHNIKSSMLSDRIPKLENKKDFETYKTHVARMLSVLYYLRLDPPHWNVTVYTQLIVAINPETYEEYIKEDLFSDEDIHASFKRCLDIKLIRKQEQDVSVDDYIKSINIDEIIAQFYYNDDLQYTYKYADLFTPEHITLAHIFNQMSLLYTQVSWINPQRGSSLDLDDLGNLYNTHQWPFFMVKHMHYHFWVVQITHTSVMYHLWVHLKHCKFIIKRHLKYGILPKVTSSVDSPESSSSQNYWPLIADPLKKAVEFFNIDDNLTLEIMNTISRDGTVITRSDLNFFEQSVRRVLLESFEALGVRKAKSILTVSNPGRKNTERSIEKNIEAFKKYTSDIEKALYPIDNLFFIKFISRRILENNEMSISPYYKTYKSSVKKFFGISLSRSYL